MKIEALKKLRDALLDWEESAERAGVTAFRMSTWVETDYSDDEWNHTCGTACCAGGLAAILGIGGLVMNTMRAYPEHMGTSAWSWRALQEAFGLGAENTEYLFHEDFYRPEDRRPEVVADRIDQLIQGGSLAELEHRDIYLSYLDGSDHQDAYLPYSDESENQHET